MAAKLKIKLNNKGFRDLRTKKEAVKILEREGAAIEKAGGPGMKASTFVGRQRARVTIITDTPAARRREAKDRALTRALLSRRR